MSETEPFVITIPKNSREEVRVQLTSYRGSNIIDVRLYADMSAGEVEGRGPTKKGVSLDVRHLEALRRAIAEAEIEAADRGWIGGAE